MRRWPQTINQPESNELMSFSSRVIWNCHVDDHISRVDFTRSWSGFSRLARHREGQVLKSGLAFDISIGSQGTHLGDSFWDMETR